MLGDILFLGFPFSFFYLHIKRPRNVIFIIVYKNNIGNQIMIEDIYIKMTVVTSIFSKSGTPVEC